MSKSSWSQYYLKKKYIIEMEDHELVNAFENVVTSITQAVNKYSRVNKSSYKTLEWIRDELLQRLK